MAQKAHRVHVNLQLLIQDHKNHHPNIRKKSLQKLHMVLVNHVVNIALKGNHVVIVVFHEIKLAINLQAVHAKCLQ